MTTRSQADQILTRRLKDVYWPKWLDALARDQRIERVKPQVEYSHTRDRFYDIKRVRFFMEALRMKRPIVPIVIDNKSDYTGSRVYWGMPFVDDGHHRFVAQVLCDREWMPASLGGLVVHHEWLRGERDDLVDPDTLTRSSSRS